jgi:hypothetical protein
LIAFEREDVLLGDVALTTHGIDAHDRALDGQQIQQLGDRDDFVGLLRHLDCPSTRRWRAAKAQIMWIGAFAPFFW